MGQSKTEMTYFYWHLPSCSLNDNRIVKYESEHNSLVEIILHAFSLQVIYTVAPFLPSLLPPQSGPEDPHCASAYGMMSKHTRTLCQLYGGAYHFTVALSKATQPAYRTNRRDDVSMHLEIMQEEMWCSRYDMSVSITIMAVAGDSL